eukprot:252218-Heterocapsa_arctica.AAC.1
MAANWARFWQWRRALAWKALTRLRRRVRAAGGRAVRFLIGVPKTLDFDQRAALIQYIQQGGTYERYLAEVQACAPRGCLAVESGRRHRGAR